MKIIERSNKGWLSRRSGGLRKCVGRALAAASEAGVRAIYYWHRVREMLLMLLIYGKNEQDDLTPEQFRILKAFVEKEFQ